MVQRPDSSGWAGWAAFAGFMMIMIGMFHAIAGLAEIIDSDAWVLGQKYVFTLNATAWGWIHLLTGLVVLFAGLGVFAGWVWARTVGVIVAMGSAIANFAWLPYNPIW